MKFQLTFFAACVMLLAYSCRDNSQDDKAVVVQELQLENISADTSILPSPPGGLSTDQFIKRKDSDRPTNDSWDKKLIKMGTLRLQVENYRRYNHAIHELVEKWGAYIATEEENISEYKIENALTIRIPVQFFDEAVRHLSTHEGKLLVKSISAQDVTGEYLDTRARMEAKKRIRARYIEMLKKAKNMEEVLQIEREINTIQEQVEAGESRVKYLGHASAYSTIHLTFFQVLNATSIGDDQPAFGKRLLLALADGARWVTDLVVFAVTLWPVWLALIFAVWMIRRFAATTRRT